MSASRLFKLVVASLLGALAVALGLAVASLGAIIMLTQTDSGRSWISARLSDAVSHDNRKIEITGLAGLPFDCHADKLTVADRDGVWLEANDLTLVWRPSSLLDGRLEIEAAKARTIRVIRPPADRTSETPVRPRQPKLPKLPNLSLPVTLDRLTVERLEVEPAVLGERAAFTLDGSLVNDVPKNVWASELEVRGIDGPEFLFRGSARLDRASQQLRIELAGEDRGLVSTLLGGEHASPLRVSLLGSGPIFDWQGDVHVGLEGLGAFDGTVSIAGEGEAATSLRGQLLFDQPPVLAESRWQREIVALFDEPLALDATVRARDDGAYSIGPVSLTSPVLDLRVESHLDEGGQLISAKGHVDVPSLHPIVAAFDLEAEGRGRLDVEMVAVDGQQGIEAAFDGAIENFDGTQALAASLLGRMPVLKGRLRYLLSRKIEISDLVLEGEGVKATGRVALGFGAQDELAGEVHVSLPDLEPLGKGLGQPITGTAEFRAKLGGGIMAPELELNGNVSAERQGAALDGDLRLDARADLAGKGRADGRAAVDALGVTMETSLEALGLRTQPALKGHLRLGEFDPRAVLKALGVSYRPADEKALRSAALQLSFEGRGGQLAVEPIQGHIDETGLDGRIDIKQFRPVNLTFALHTGRLDLDRYQPRAKSDAEASEEGANGLNAEALAEKWRTLGLKGVIQMDELILNGQSSKDLEIDLNWDP